jgi:thioredoxin-related protein
MKRATVVFILFLTATFSFGQNEAGSTSTQQKINWLSFEEAFALHQTAPKKWVIDVSTEWCGWCKRMDQTTFSDSLVIEHVTANFYAVALDGEHKEDITIGDQTYKFVAEGRRGYNQLPAELMGGKMSYPTIIFFGDDLQNYGPVPGYRDARDFLQLLEFFEVYHPVSNPISWDAFSANYVSPYPAPVTGE